MSLSVTHVIFDKKNSYLAVSPLSSGLAPNGSAAS